MLKIILSLIAMYSFMSIVYVSIVYASDLFIYIYQNYGLNVYLLSGVLSVIGGYKFILYSNKNNNLDEIFLFIIFFYFINPFFIDLIFYSETNIIFKTLTYIIILFLFVFIIMFISEYEKQKREQFIQEYIKQEIKKKISSFKEKNNKLIGKYVDKFEEKLNKQQKKLPKSFYLKLYKLYYKQKIDKIWENVNIIKIVLSYFGFVSLFCFLISSLYLFFVSTKGDLVEFYKDEFFIKFFNYLIHHLF